MQMIQDIAIVAMEGDGAISNDLEQTITLFLRSHQYTTL